MTDWIFGRNAVLEALRGGREIEKLMVGKGAGGSVRQITGIARDRKIPVQYSEKAALDRLTEGGAHQGVAARVATFRYCEIGDILHRAEERGEDPFIILLDGLEDPHNLGAVIRSAECCGAHGVIIPKRRSADITETVGKASAGAVEHLLCAKVPNMGQAIDGLKEAGLWIGACDMGGTLYHQRDLTGKLGLVIGGEGAGISRLVREKCDFTVSIPIKGKISSFNASNAAAVIMCEVVRQRDRT